MESTICQTEDQTPSQTFSSFGDFYGFFESLVEESRDENKKIELHIFPKKPFEKATNIEVKTIQKLQLNDKELPDQPKFSTTTQNFQVFNTTTKKSREINGGQTSSYRTTVPEQESAITVEDDNQNKVNEYSWRYSKELDDHNTQNNASVRDLTNKNLSLEICENSQQDENCSTITYHYILDDDFDSFDNSNPLQNDVDSSSTVHSDSAKTNDVPILITNIKLEKEDFHAELRQEPGRDLPSENSQNVVESRGRRKSRKPGRPRKYRSKVTNLSTFEGLKQKGRPKGSLNKKAKFNKHLWETVEIPDYSRSRRVDELTQKGIDDQTVHLLQEEFIPSKQLACSGLESAHSYQLETNNVEKDLACDESSSLNQIMITDTRSIAEQQFAGSSERNKSDEISIVYDNNSSGFEGIYGENNLNEEQLQNVATFQLVNKSSLLPNTTEKLDRQALSDAIENEQTGKQQRNEVPSSENTVVIENVFGDVIYVVAEGSRYAIQKEDGSIKNTELNSSSTSLILNNSSSSFQNHQEQLQPIYTLINTYPTGIVKNAYATLANSNVAGDIHDGQQTLSLVVCENQLPHFNSLLENGKENNMFTCLALEPNRSSECEAKQTLSKRKLKTVNNTETTTKRQKYSTMRKTNVHLLNRWNKNPSKRKKGQSQGLAGIKHSKIGFKVEKCKTKKKSSFSNESRKSKVKINQLLKRGPGRPKQSSTELINEKKKRGRPSKVIASELNFSQEKFGNIIQNNESVSTAVNKRTWKYVSKLKSNDKLEKLKAKVVTKQKGRYTSLPKKRGVGRPRKKIDDGDIKLNTTKNLTPLKLHFNRKYPSFEDSTVTVSNDIPIADGLKDETFAEIKKKRGRPKKNKQIMSAIDTETLPDELHSNRKQVSLIEKGKFLDFWETKRAKRQTSKFPFKMRGKHKVVTLMNLEIPLQRISKDIKPKMKRHGKRGRGRPKLKHNVVNGPKTKNSELLAIQSKDVNVNGSTSSISNYTEIVVSQENNIIDTAGNVQSNLQNRIAIGNTRITNEIEIKLIEAENTTETNKVLKENNCERRTAPIIRTEQSLISTDGPSMTEFHSDQDKNKMEFYKCQNLSENSEESHATEDKKSGNGNGNEIAVRQPISESKDFEKSYLELNVVPVNGNKDVVVKNLDISVSLVSKELIVKPIKERSSLALNYKCLNATTKLSKPDISCNFNTPDKLEKADYAIGISTDSDIGPAIISNKNESPIQAVKIPDVHGLENFTSSIGPISQNDTQNDYIKLPEETIKSWDTASSQYKLQSFEESVCPTETGNAQLLTTENIKSINNSPKKTVGRPRKQTFDNVKNDSVLLHIDTKFREKEKVLETITITKKKGRPPKSAKQHCKSEVLSVHNILPFKHNNVRKKKQGRPKKSVIQSINHSVNTKKTSKQINVRNKSIYLEKNLKKSNIDSEVKTISALPGMVAMDANYACRHQKKIDGVHQNKESLTDNDFTNSVKRQSGNIIHGTEETPTVRWEETDKKCFKLVKPQNSNSPNENIQAKYKAENVTIKIKRRNIMQDKHKAFSHATDSCRNRKLESGNSLDAAELTTNLGSNVNELNVYEECGEQPDQSMQLNEIAGFYFPKTINSDKNYCDTADSTIRNKGFIDDCVTAVASCSNADKVECSLKNDETEMEKLEIVITDNFVKKRGRPPKMPVLTMENMENMFDKIKKGREKKTKLTDLELENSDFVVNSDKSPLFPFDFTKTEENQNVGPERPKKKQTVENKDYISTIRHCLDVKMSTKRKLNSFKNTFARSKKAGSRIENARKILPSAETINDNLDKLVDVQETRVCDSLMFQKSRGRPKKSKGGYHLEPYMYCGDVARKKDGRGRPKKSFESSSFNNIVRNVKTIYGMKNQRINKRENEKDENIDSQTVKKRAGKGRKKKTVVSVFQNFQSDGRKCQGDEFKNENDIEAKGVQTYSILEDFTDSNNEKLDLIKGSNSYSPNSCVKKSVVRPFKRVNIESSIVFDRKHGKNKTLMKISRRGRPKKLLVKEIHQDQSFNQETFKQPGKQYKFATKTGLDRPIKEFSKEMITTDIVQKQNCDRVYETDSRSDEIRKECDEKISENMLNTGIFKTENVCNSISSNKDKEREQFPKDVNIKKRKNFSKLKPTCATAELIKRRRPKKSKEISYEDILDKIRLHASETPTKKTKRGRPKKAANLVECEKHVLKSNPEYTVLPPTKVKTQKTVSKVGNPGAQSDRLFNSKDVKESKCIATNVRSNKEKPNNLYSIGNIEKISGIKKTTGNVYVDNETFLKLKQLAGTKTEKNSCHKSNNTLQLKKMVDSLINTERNIGVPEDDTKASQTKQCFECLTNDLTSHSTQNDMQQDNLKSSLNMLNDCSTANSTKEVLNEELTRLKCNYEVIFDINDTLAQRNDNVTSQSTTCISP